MLWRMSGKHACVDLTEVLLLVGLRADAFTTGQTNFKAASSKVVEHEKSCSDNQHASIPFVFDIFDFLAPDYVSLCKDHCLQIFICN
jgi:hypothetical protein